jgi:hypothetical protein
MVSLETTKAHAEQIRLARLEWEIPKQAHQLNLRNPTMAVPVETDSDITSSSESNDHTPLAKIAKRFTFTLGNANVSICSLSFSCSQLKPRNINYRFAD